MLLDQLLDEIFGAYHKVINAGKLVFNFFFLKKMRKYLGPTTKLSTQANLYTINLNLNMMNYIRNVITVIIFC